MGTSGLIRLGTVFRRSMLMLIRCVPTTPLERKKRTGPMRTKWTTTVKPTHNSFTIKNLAEIGIST